KEFCMQHQPRSVVVGAGTMGMTLARLMASRDMPVTLLDIDKDRLAYCRQLLATDENTADCVDFASDWQSTGEVGAVIESVTENLDLKRRVLLEAERHVSDEALIMTNTSGLSIDAL